LNLFSLLIRDEGNEYWRALIKAIEIKAAAIDAINKMGFRRKPSTSRARDGATLEELNENEATRAEETLDWLRETRMAADPSLRYNDDINKGQASFDAYWRTLIYNADEAYTDPSPALGTSFGYWYLLQKLIASRAWRRDARTYELQRELLVRLSEPFGVASFRFRGPRHFFVSASGRPGWAPLRASRGDQIFVFQGSQIPFVAKPVDIGWEYVGACYVHGVMEGRAWDLEGLHWQFMRFV
jgi:hypothetical protein